MAIGCCINDLRDKEVINIIDGRRLGYVDDIEVDICNGRLVSIIVPGCGDKWFGLSKGRDIVILWENIEKIGDDTILVKINVEDYAGGEFFEGDRGKRRRFFF